MSQLTPADEETAPLPGAFTAPTLCHAFQRTSVEFADDIALRAHEGSADISWSDYAARVRRVAAGLAAAGIARGDTVAMMVTNRPEALIVDTAAMHLGATPFAVYNTSPPDQIAYVLANAGARIVVTEAAFLDKILQARGQLADLSEIVVLDGPVAGARTLEELEASGADDFDFEAAWRAVDGGDIALLIYTSGTTGPPKGVELTHDNLLATLHGLHMAHPLRAKGRLVSWLPLAHLADRVAAHYLSLITGASVTCVADPRAVVQALPAIQPTVFLAVPRIWEKLKAALELQLAGPHGAALRAGAARALGLDDADLALSGAAPIAPEVLEFFAGLGIEIYEAWGMSETSAAGAIAPKGAHRVGTVGKPWPGLELRLAQDGELLVRGRAVMRGYRKQPDKTAEAIDAAGWMHTGDIGSIDDDGYVRIIDRKKELIINAAGKNMSPANIENALKSSSPLIGQAAAIGDRRPYNTALIVLDADYAPQWATQQGIQADTLEALASEQQVIDAVQEGVDEANKHLARVEQIKKFTIVPGDWAPGGDELTPTMKLKRKPIADKYEAEIDAMYR